jgi:hypothetical protein
MNRSTKNSKSTIHHATVIEIDYCRLDIVIDPDGKHPTVVGLAIDQATRMPVAYGMGQSVAEAASNIHSQLHS